MPKWVYVSVLNVGMRPEIKSSVEPLIGDPTLPPPKIMIMNHRVHGLYQDVRIRAQIPFAVDIWRNDIAIRVFI
jgi:hypothetical protein